VIIFLACFLAFLIGFSLGVYSGQTTERKAWLLAAAQRSRRRLKSGRIFSVEEVPDEIPVPKLWYLRWYSHTEYVAASFDVTRSGIKYRGYVEAWIKDEAESFIRAAFPGAHVTFTDSVQGSYEDVEPGGWHRAQQPRRPIKMLAEWIGRGED